jgi:hypothetical protein
LLKAVAETSRLARKAELYVRRQCARPAADVVIDNELLVSSLQS